MGAKVVAITGSYRKDGTINRAVEAVLAGAREKGAETAVVRLTEKHIEFCANCRQCVQAPGEKRGKCPQKDDLEGILLAVEAADAVVLAAPVNYYNVTAIFRRFLERLICFGYWPWGAKMPKWRSRKQPRKAVLVASAAMPGFLIPLATGAPRALKAAAGMLDARVVGKLWAGLASMEPHQELSARMQERARQMGWKLA